MATADRPGGLTAIGSLNLIFGVILLFTPFSLLQLKNQSFSERALENDEFRRIFDAVQEVPDITWWFLIVLAVVQGLIYIVSSIGFFKMKRLAGYLFGNAVAVLSIGAVIANLFLLPEEVDNFSLQTIVALFYPLLLLYLVNVVFREDLAR